MTKTFKGKLTLLYMTLVLTIAVLAICSVVNIYNLKNSINTVMINNYISINVSDNMSRIVEEQNLIAYSNIYDKNSNSEFLNLKQEFYKFYKIELDHISEKGERDLVMQLGKLYEQYIDKFEYIHNNKDKLNSNEAIKYYNNEIVPILKTIRQRLNELISVNEKSMVNTEKKISQYAEDSVYILIFISSIVIVASLLISRKYLNKVVQPILELTTTIKKVRAGDLNQQAKILSDDEIGILAKEFNNMTRRLSEFEKSALGQIIEEKNKNETIIQNSTTPLVMLDRNYKITLVNTAFKKFLNLDERRVNGKDISEIILNEEALNHINEACKNISDKCNSIEKTIEFNFDDDSLFFNIIVTGIRDRVNEEYIKNYIVLFQNVTEFKIIEKMKSDFVSAISHEFKTPLTSLMIGASLLKDESLGEINDKQKDIIETFDEDIEKLSTLVMDILRLTKLEGGKELYKCDEISVRNLILTSVQEFYNMAEDKNIEINYEIQKDIPNINGDFEKLLWALNNLISNAIKYTFENGMVNIRAYKSNYKVYISIKDNGIGIPEEYLYKIFDKFTRVSSDTKGTGLGLYIVKQIVENNKGQVWCESIIGQGSEFIIALPINSA